MEKENDFETVDIKNQKEKRTKTDTTTLHLRVDTEIKDRVQGILEDIGLDMTTAVNMFFRQIIYNQGIPFPLQVDDFHLRYQEFIRLIPQRTQIGVPFRIRDIIGSSFPSRMGRTFAEDVENGKILGVTAYGRDKQGTDEYIRNDK